MPGATIKRLLATRSSVNRKYHKVIRQLSRNRKLIAEIGHVAALYEIDPIHMIGALVGEHSFNVDAFDSMQVYYIKAASYLKLDTNFGYDGEPVSAFVKRPQFAGCAVKEDSYARWACCERIWNMIFAGRTVDGVDYAGQTFGLGQISPLAALKANDMVVRVGGLPRLSADRPGEVYFTIMDPRQSLHYMAAIIRHAIDSYRDIAGMDISENPGITATLYNLGGARTPGADAELRQWAQPDCRIVGPPAGRELLRLAGQRPDRRA
jgi:hypothetical protein